MARAAKVSARTRRASKALGVRAARPADLATLLAFNLAMARETEGKRLRPARLRSGLARVLRDPARGRYRVAVRDGRVVGALMLTTEWSDWRDGWWWWVQSVYVLPEERGRGVYAALHRSVLDEAAAAGDVRGLRLYVETGNAAAQAVYERLGMERARYAMYEVALPARRRARARGGSRAAR